MPDIFDTLTDQQPSGDVFDSTSTSGGVGKEIIDRVEWVESRGNPNAVSKKGAIGKMQTMPGTLRDPGYGVAPAKDKTPEELKRVGVDYLNALYRKYGDLKKALAAYNWGPKKVDAAVLSDPQGWEKKLPSETKNYISKIVGTQTAKGDIFDTISPQKNGDIFDSLSTSGGSFIDGAISTVKGLATDVGKNIVGKGEAALSTATGLLATPVAGIGGLLYSNFGQNPEAGEAVVQGVSDYLTYKPQTERGIQETETLQKPLELLDRGTGWVGEKVSDITGSPLAGAVAKTGLMFALPAGLGKLAKTALVKGSAKIPTQEGRVAFVNDVLKESKETGVPVENVVEMKMKQPVESPEMRPVASEAVGGIDTPTITDFANVDKYEAYVKGGSTSPLPKYAEGSAINLERLDTTMDVKQLLNQLAKESKMEKTVKTWEQTTKDARDLAWDEKDFLKRARTKGAFTAKEIDAMRQIHTNAITDLQRTLREIPADRTQITDATRLEILDKVNNYIEIMKATSRKSSEAGRALNIHKRMIAEDPDFIANTNMQKAMKQIMEKRGGKKLTDDLIRDLKDVDWKDPASVKDILKKYNRASVGDMVYEAWLNGILSNPPTHATNILSNTMTVLTKVPEHGIASVLQGRMPVGEMKAETIGLVRGLREGVRAGLKAFKTGEASEMWNKVETARTPAIPGKVGEAVRIPTKALTGADEFFKAIVYRSEMNRLAFLEAKKSGAKGRALAEKMAEILDNPSADILEKCHTEALYRTFNKPLGHWGNKIMNLRDDTAIGKTIRYIFPFVRTPGNIIKYTLERTPAGMGKTLLDLKRGNLTKAEMYDDFSRQAIGTAIGVVIYQMAKEGIVTGGGPKNPAEREMKFRTGWQPYSIKVGDTYYSYGRLEPMGSILGMSADLADMAGMEDDAKAGERFGRIAMSISKNLTSKTWVSSASRMLDAVSDPQRYGKDFVNQLAGSVVPSVVGGITRAKDSTIYSTDTPFDVVKAKAGVTGDMFPRRDIWGRPIERAGTTATRALSPVVPSQAKDDPVDLEMDRLNLAIAPPAKKVRGVELEPAEYDAYAKRAGELSRERVERYMSGGAYRLLRDELKKLAIKNIVEKSRVQAGVEIWKDMERARRFKPIDKKYGTNLSGLPRGGAVPVVEEEQ